MKDFVMHAAGIGTFLIEAGIIYGIVTHDLNGTPLILTVGAGFLYLFIYLVWASRKVRPAVDVGAPSAIEAEEEPHVLPTIWPLVFSVAAVLLVVGAVTTRWFLLAGGIVFVVAGVGWFIDTVKQWKHPPTHSPLPGPATDVVDVDKRA